MIEFFSDGKVIVEFIVAIVSVSSCIGSFMNKNKANEALIEIKKLLKERL